LGLWHNRGLWDGSRGHARLGEEPDEFSDDLVRIQADCHRIVPDERAPEDARGPPGEVVALHPGVQSRAHLGLLGNLVEGQATSLAGPPKLGTEG
jgi:hypothetical protein